jgi:hypothetical protein
MGSTVTTSGTSSPVRVPVTSSLAKPDEDYDEAAELDSSTSSGCASVTSSPSARPLVSRKELMTIAPGLINLQELEGGSLFSVFGAVFTHVHLLWELVMTAEPLVVMAPTPATAAATVQGLLR